MTDLSVLDFERIPSHLPHRNNELQTIRSALSGIQYGDQGDPVTIYGPSGAGKTSVAVEAARKANREWGNQYAVTDCIRHRTRAALLHEMAAKLGMTAIHRESTPPGRYHDYFRDEVEQAVVIIDEAGQLSDLDVIQELTDSPSLTPIVIIHDEAEFMSRLPVRIASRLRSGPTVQCDPYHVDELVDILNARLRAGSLSHLIRDQTLEVVADHAVGNARDAIALTKRLVEEARRTDSVARPEDVTELAPDAEKRVIRHNLAKLDTEHRVIYQIIYEAGEIQAPELKDRIDDRLGLTDSERARCLNALQGSYQVIEAEGSTRWRTYRPIADVPARDPLPSE